MGKISWCIRIVACFLVKNIAFFHAREWTVHC